MAGTQYQTLIIPYWAPLVLTVIAPLVALMCFLLSKRTGPAFEILPLQKDAGP